MKVFLAVCAVLLSVSALGAERYSYVRTFKVDGKEVRLAADETELDLLKSILTPQTRMYVGSSEAKVRWGSAIIEGETQWAGK